MDLLKICDILQQNTIMKQVALLNIFNYILAYIHLLIKSVEGNWWG